MATNDSNTLTAPVQTTFRASYPLNFYAHDGNDQSVLYITDNPVGQNLVITITNQTSTPYFIPAPTSTTPSKNSHQLELRFRPNTIKASKEQVISIMEPGWSIVLFNHSNGIQSLYIQYNAAIDWAANGSHTFTIQGIGVMGSLGARSTRVEMVYSNLKSSIKSQALSGSRSEIMQIVNHEGSSATPFYFGISGSNKVLNNGVSENDITIIIGNKTDSDLPLNIASPTSTFAIAFDGGDASATPWALATADQLSGMGTPIVTPTGWSVTKDTQGDLPTWILSLENTSSGQSETGAGKDGSGATVKGSISADTPIKITFPGLVTNHPNGLTNLTLRYKNVPNYWDNHLITKLEKSPLIIDDTRVGLGTKQPTTNLDVNGSISLKSSLNIGRNLQVGGNLSVNQLQVNGGAAFQNMQAGQLTVGSNNDTQGVFTVKVSFVQPFSDVPVAVCTPQGQDNHSDTLSVTICSISTHGMSINIRRVDHNAPNDGTWGQNLLLNWMAWEAPKTPKIISGAATSETSAMASFNNILYLFYKQPDAQVGIHQNKSEAPEWLLNPSTPLNFDGDNEDVPGGVGTSSYPSATVFEDKLIMAYKGVPGDPRIFTIGMSSTGVWDNSCANLNTACTTNVAPAIVTLAGNLYVFYQGSGAIPNIWCSSGNSVANLLADSAHQMLPSGITSLDPPKAVAFGKSIYVFFRTQAAPTTISYVKLSNDMTTWSETITQEVPGAATHNPMTVTVTPGYIYLAFIHSKDKRICTAATSDGDNWTSWNSLEDQLTIHANSDLALAFFKGHLCLNYKGLYPGDTNIYNYSWPVHGPGPLIPTNVASLGTSAAFDVLLDSDQNLDLFYIDTNGALCVLSLNGGSWPNPTTISNDVQQGSAIASLEHNGTKEVFFIGSAGGINNSSYNGTSWSTPTSVLGSSDVAPGSKLVAGNQLSDQVDVLYEGAQGGLYVTFRIDGDSWSKANYRITDSGTMGKNSFIAAANQGSEQLDGFFTGPQGGVYVSWVYGGGSWAKQATISGMAPAGTGLTAIQLSANKTVLYFVGSDGAIYETYESDGSAWNTPTATSSPGIAMGTSPLKSVISPTGEIYLFFMGPGNKLYWMHSDINGNWGDAEVLVG